MVVAYLGPSHALSGSPVVAKVPISEGSSDADFDSDDWVFAKRNSRMTVILNLINLPMTNSATFKKLMRSSTKDDEADTCAKAGKGAASKLMSDELKQEFNKIGIVSQPDRKKDALDTRKAQLEEAKATITQ